MKSNNEQTTGRALEGEKNSQAFKTEENSKREETSRGTNGRLFETQETDSENSESPNVQGLPMEEAEDVVSQFVAKGATRAEEYLEIVSDMLGDPASYGYAT